MDGYEIAAQTEHDNPDWIVVFGRYTRQYVCFPLFHAPPGTFFAVTYPGALAPRMRAIEQWLNVGSHRSGS